MTFVILSEAFSCHPERSEGSQRVQPKVSIVYIFRQHHYYIYIVTNPERTVLYTGVTNNLSQRLIEHYANRGNPKTFAGKFFCYNLIYYEEFSYILNAIAREKEIKGWVRQKKLNLIKSQNPDWTFLNIKVCGEWPPVDVSKRG